MMPLVLWSLVLVIGLTGVVVSANSLRFQRAVAREAQALGELPPSMQPFVAEGLDRLPPPVARYLDLALGERRTPVDRVHLHHGGAMRMRPGAAWTPIRGEQFLVSDPPGFVWWGRIRLAPGAWVDARDTLADGRASMRVLAESTISIGDVKGPELDQSAAIRLLGEMLWFPTSYLDSRYVTWSAIDDSRARARLHLRDLDVTAVFHFGADGLPARIAAERWREAGGTNVLTPWFGEARDYRRVSGILVPFVMEATWELETGPFPCIRFEVDRVELDPRPAPTARRAAAEAPGAGTSLARQWWLHHPRRLP